MWNKNQWNKKWNKISGTKISGIKIAEDPQVLGGGDPQVQVQKGYSKITKQNENQQNKNQWNKN